MGGMIVRSKNSLGEWYYKAKKVQGARSYLMFYMKEETQGPHKGKVKIKWDWVHGNNTPKIKEGKHCHDYSAYRCFYTKGSLVGKCFTGCDIYSSIKCRQCCNWSTKGAPPPSTGCTFHM